VTRLDDDLARHLSELARTLGHEDDPAATLDGIVRAAIELIPGAEHASVSVVVKRRRVESRAASGDLPRRVDEVQDQVQQGPCLDAAYEHRTVRVPDLSCEQRWPDFASRAWELGAGSMLSFQLYVEDDTLGALNLYAGTAHAFDEESEHVGLLFASHAAVAYAGVRRIGDLRQRETSREVISQAQGILMERHKLTADRAFALLVRVSQDTNRKLRDVAATLVGTGELGSRE
jgi:transcriptional regulator with GAF, ATPase, and Fis domain